MIGYCKCISLLKILITDTFFSLWNILKYVQYIIWAHEGVSVNNMADENIYHN